MTHSFLGKILPTDKSGSTGWLLLGCCFLQNPTVLCIMPRFPARRWEYPGTGLLFFPIECQYSLPQSHSFPAYLKAWGRGEKYFFFILKVGRNNLIILAALMKGTLQKGGIFV